MSQNEVYGTRHAHAAKHPLPRTTCPLCGRDVALRRGGQLREHRSFEGAFGKCSASGHTPEGAVAAVASRAREIAEQARRTLIVGTRPLSPRGRTVDPFEEGRPDVS